MSSGMQSTLCRQTQASEDARRSYLLEASSSSGEMVEPLREASLPCALWDESLDSVCLLACDHPTAADCSTESGGQVPGSLRVAAHQCCSALQAPSTCSCRSSSAGSWSSKVNS